MSYRPNEYQKIAADVQIGDGAAIYDSVNLYGRTIGDGTKIGTFVDIKKEAHVGAHCKISSHTFNCDGVTIEDGCFVGRHVCFINDLAVH